MKTLYCKTSKNITLEQAVQECSHYLADAIGLIYSPQKCCFIKIKSGKIEQPPIETLQKQEVNLKLVFEARIFNQQVELRWLNERNGEGKAVLLSEKTLTLDWNQPEKLEAIAIQPQQYILWGQSNSNSEVREWSQLFSNRIGSLYVPCSNVQNRVYLKTCEYFNEDDYGNVSVVEERLISLEVK